MQSKRLVYYISIMLVIILAVSISGCGSSTTTTSTTTEQSKYGGTFRQLESSSAEGIIGIPWEIRNNAGPIVPCIDHLVTVDFQGNISPELATDWEIADDGKSITFTLRQDVKFHDGTTFDAAAAKWNLDNWMAAKKDGTQTWTSIEVIDPYTVRIDLSEFRNTVFDSLSMDYCGPISPTAYEKNGKEWAEKNPVGTGPFKLVSFNPDVGWSYVRNDEYWNGKPYLDAIECKVVLDLNVTQMMLENGEAETCTLLGAQGTEIKIALTEKGWQLIPLESGGDPFCLWPDSANAESPWSKKEVRLAADFALNKEDISLLGKGLWIPSWQLATPTHNFYDPSLTRKYDPAKAQELLEEAGYGTGFNTTIYYDATTPTDLVVALQSYFGDVGINADLKILAPSDAFLAVTQGWSNGVFAIPFGIKTNFLQSIEQNFAMQKMSFVSVLGAPEIQSYIDAGLSARTIEERAELSGQAVKYVFDEVLTIPLYRPDSLGVLAPYVHDAGFGNAADWTPELCWMSK